MLLSPHSMENEIREHGIDNRFVRLSRERSRDKFAPATVAFRVNANQLHNYRSRATAVARNCFDSLNWNFIQKISCLR